jgi:hypothetical protein
MFGRFIVLMISVNLGTELYAASFILRPDVSHLRYQINKYGTMLVEGQLAEDKKDVLSGQFSLSDFDSLRDLNGHITLSHAEFRSGHVRRDDEVMALFRTPVTLSFTGKPRCEPNRVECEVPVQLTLNETSRSFDVPLRVFLDDGSEKNRVRVQGALRLIRQDYDLIFRSGFSAALDTAISDDLLVEFDLAFNGSVQDLGRFSKVPKASLLDAEQQQTFPVNKPAPWWQGWIEQVRSQHID